VCRECRGWLRAAGVDGSTQQQTNLKAKKKEEI
jgi:hypothetical protein